MKTFDEICDEVAKEYGYHDWLTLKDDFCMSYEGYKPYLLKAVERYANYKAEIAFEEAKKLTIKRAIECSEEDFGLDNFHGRMRPFTITNPYKQK